MTGEPPTGKQMPLPRLARWQLGVPLALALLALMATNATQRLDWWFYDTLIGQFPLSPPPHLSLVGIDEASLEALGRWPWPRSYHARLVDRLANAGAEVIVFDVLFTEPAQDPQQDRTLAEAIHRKGRVVLPLHLYPLRSEDTLTERLPTPILTAAAAALGHVHVELDDDGIARGLYLREGLGRAVWPSLAAAALELTGRTLPLGPRHSAAPFVNIRQGRIRIPFAGLGGAIPTYSYADVLVGKLAAGALKGHTVFVGATAAGFGDVLPTPLSGNAYPLSGVEFHANVYSALAQNAVIRTLPTPVTAGFGLVLVLVITLIFPWLRPNQTLLGASLLAALPISLSLILFAKNNLWMPPAGLALVCLLAYPIWSGRRLAVLNQFLNRQLEALAREPRLSLRAPENPAPTRLFEQLQELLEPHHAWLCMGEQNIRGLRPDACAPLAEAGKWSHEGDMSRITLMHKGQQFELGLVWDSELHDREALSRYLNRLPLQGKDSRPVAKRSSERLTQRIQQVRAAIDAMADMRSFIGTGFERMPDGVIVTDALGVIQVANYHVADWFGVPTNSLPGMPLVRLLDSSLASDRQRWHLAIQAALTQQRYRTESLQLDGHDLLLHLAPFPSPDGQRLGLIANVVDITDVREQQRQYREAIDFISHDVRSPLVSQLALIQQLKRQEEPASPAQLDHVARLAKRSYQLAEEFVQLARAEQLAEIQFYEFEVLAIAENAVDAVQDQAQAKDITLDIDGDESLWLQGNAELAERAVINLLTNAITYSPAGSAIQVSVQAAGQHTMISVRDHGSGIPADELPLLFQRFKRSRQEEQGGNPGAGLGLAFVQVVAERHGGWVDVSSTLGQGSTFRLFLPLAEVL
jgi:PAS domain S-box-containing protein